MGRSGILRSATSGLAAVLLAAAAGHASAQTASFDHAHDAFAALLRAHLHEGRVDYAGLKREREALERYVESLAAADAATLAESTRDEQLAYWLNAYNAFVLATVADHYPIRRRSLVGIAFPANSIWQIPGAFRGKRFNAAGRRVSLDDIEHRIVRPAFQDARVHMALVCAARSCPALRSEPYRAAVLDEQLDDQSRRFVADMSKGVRVDERTREVRVSSIFKWFGEDFAPLAGGDIAAGVLEFVARYTEDPARAALLRSGTLRLAYLDYDWNLNE